MGTWQHCPLLVKLLTPFLKSERREELSHIAQVTQPGQTRTDFVRIVTLSQKSYVEKQKMCLLLTLSQAFCPTSWSAFPQRNIILSSIIVCCFFFFSQLFFYNGGKIIAVLAVPEYYSISPWSYLTPHGPLLWCEEKEERNQEGNKSTLRSLQWHYNPLSIGAISGTKNKELETFTPFLLIAMMKQDEWTVAYQRYSNIFHFVPQCLLICSLQKANHIAAESCIVTEPKGTRSFPVCLHTEKMAVTVTVCPCCLCHFHPKDCVHISSALNLRGKICYPVSHILQDINPFTELLRFLPLLLAPEKIFKKITSKQSEFEDHNRMGL